MVLKHSNNVLQYDVDQERYQAKTVRVRARMLLRKYYQHPLTRGLFILAICANFVCDAIVANNPSGHEASAAGKAGVGGGEGGGAPEQLPGFRELEIAFTTLFVVELCWNAASHWFWPFVREGWNWLDMVVVVGSVISLAIADSIPNLSLVRTLRLLRVVRYVHSLRKFVGAISAALLPVLSAALIVVMVMCIYAVIGVGVYGQAHPGLPHSLARSPA